MYEVRIARLEEMFEELTKRANEGDELASAERARVYNTLIKLKRKQWEHDQETQITLEYNEHDY